MIEIKDLMKKYEKGVLAVNRVNLSIGEGIFGLLGENGAGKTTLMRILLTLVEPSGGSVWIDGLELKSENYEKVRKIVGYLPQELGLYPNLTVRESLEYMGDLSGMEKKKCRSRIDYFLDVTSLSEHQKKKNRQLSGGMKRRVGLIQAMLHDPKILIVDEPTTGLDPEERIRIRNLLVSFSKNKTVIFSTHVVEDLAATCNKLGILKRGNVIYEGSIGSLINETKGCVWTTTLNSEEEFQDFTKKYRITSKQYKEGGIEVRFLSDQVTDIKCLPMETTLEDAYIYKTNN